jgi:hypothetical protein
METISMKCWNALKWLFQTIAMPVTKLRGNRRVGQVIRWTLHLLCLAGVLVGLGFLNYALGVDKLLRAPWPVARQLWLPLLFLLMYACAWLGWWVWRLTHTWEEPSPFPEVDRAWNEITDALELAGVDLTRTPLFLVLGRPAGPEAALFEAAGLSLSVAQTPRRADAPLHAYATADGIYVTCSESSLFGQYAGIMADEAASAARRDAAESCDLGEVMRTPVEQDAASASAACSPQNHAEPFQEAVALLVDDEPAEAAPKPQTPQPQADALAVARRRRREQLDTAETVRHYNRRLEHICRLIAADRQPFCPLNGILVLIPLASTNDQTEANEAAVLMQRDLDVVHQVMRVRCPVLSMVCDLEKMPGGRELLRRFPEQQRFRRLGVAVPAIADCDAKTVPLIVDQAVAWVCRNLLPPLIYRIAYGQDPASIDSPAERRGNVELYRLLHEMRRRQSHLARMLIRGLFSDPEESPWRLGGCYLAATGPDATTQQGFVGGVFPQLLQMQNKVAWTEEALADDRRSRYWTVAGYATLAVFLGGTFWLALWL